MKDAESIYKNLLHFYILITNYQKEKGRDRVYNCIKERKYLGKNLTEKIKVQYMKTMTLMNKTEDDTNKWKDSTCSWIGRINIVKMSIVLKAIYRFSAIPIKIPMAFFPQIGEITPKFVWGYKRS